MKLRVQVLCETDDDGAILGCGHIRLLRPLTHPALADSLELIAETDNPQGGVDAVVVERCWRSNVTLEKAEKLVSAIRRNGSAFIYTLDDNLLDLHDNQPWQAFPTDEQRNVVRYFLRHADGVIVSTHALKSRLSGLNRNIFIVPNALDERLFPECGRVAPLDDEGNSRLVIGYMGTYSHLGDLMMVLEPLRSILQRFQGRVEFQMVGVSTDFRLPDIFSGLPFRALDNRGCHAYPDFVAWAAGNLHWDIAIAPLEDNAFTRCKSDIKFLDYALLGIPGIYSDVEAYRYSVRHEESGWLCPNAPHAWLNALDRLIGEPALCQRIRRFAHEQVTQARVLKHCAVSWKDAIIGCVDVCGKTRTLLI